MKPRKVTTIWTCKDKTEIRICDMTDSHLLNAARFTERRADEERAKALSHYPSFQGEMAQYFAEQEWNALVKSDDPADIYPIYNDLLDEIERRGLTAQLNQNR